MTQRRTGAWSPYAGHQGGRRPKQVLYAHNQLIYSHIAVSGLTRPNSTKLILFVIAVKLDAYER